MSAMQLYFLFMGLTLYFALVVSPDFLLLMLSRGAYGACNEFCSMICCVPAKPDLLHMHCLCCRSKA